ncbi:TPA: PTS sugar transporter subunit IIA [Streptococcus agalactiae]|nr:PTS sugar transporter subunit IIA [Streptococcus agalactiae]
MKIQDLLKKEVMIMDLKATSKEAAIDEMITKLVDTGVVTNFAIFKDGIMKREAQTSTGLGDGIAMPHSKNAAVKEATVLFAKSASGVDYEALDGQPTDLFFMIAAPDGANDTHLAALAELSKYLLKEGFADQLRQAKTPDDIIATFDSNSISQETVAPQTVQSTSKGSDYIVAVTACTTGIAHTYMAEEALKKKAAEMGVGIKVETNGASGVGNKLTSSDIARAKGVIIAADKAVEMDRFDGKPLVSRPVADGIKSILLYPLLGVLITGFLMLLVNIPMAAINTALNTFLQGLSGSSAVLMGLLVGGMMAVDMGGPVNKAAYVFGTGTLAATVANGGSVVMAAVMAGGMVPPLAVFVATLLFKDKFNNEERQSGLTNIVMGLSFITEGAIPFGAADPARAIPSFIVGSALTGALVGLAGIKLMAPHGGIFVIALTSNPLLYILFILIGAVVSGVLFGLFRKIK